MDLARSLPQYLGGKTVCQVRVARALSTHVASGARPLCPPSPLEKIPAAEAKHSRSTVATEQATHDGAAAGCCAASGEETRRTAAQADMPRTAAHFGKLS